MASRDNRRALGFRHRREQRESDEVWLRLVSHKAGEPEEDSRDGQVVELVVPCGDFWVCVSHFRFALAVLFLFNTPLKIS
jgi:hypothetical protein